MVLQQAYRSVCALIEPFPPQLHITLQYFLLQSTSCMTIFRQMSYIGIMFICASVLASLPSSSWCHYGLDGSVAMLPLSLSSLFEPIGGVFSQQRVVICRLVLLLCRQYVILL